MRSSLVSLYQSELNLVIAVAPCNHVMVLARVYRINRGFFLQVTVEAKAMAASSVGFTNLADVAGTPGDTKDTSLPMRLSTPSKSSNDRHKKKGHGTSRRLLPLDLSAFDMTQKSKRIFQKKDLAEAVRRVNMPIMLLQRDPPPSVSEVPESDAAAAGNKDVAILEDGVNINARKYNERRRVAVAKEKELHHLLDEFKTMQLETETLEKIHNQESTGAKEIQRLNADIDECMLSMEEKATNQPPNGRWWWRKLLREIDFKRKAGSDLSAANMEISQRAADHDQVFMQMKQVTGASSLQDVVDKFAAQNSSNASLEKEKARAEARLAAAKASKEGAIKSLNDLKASGIGGIELNRDVYTALESEILVAKGQLKGNKAAYDCLDGVLAAVRQGASSLVQRLVPFDDLLEINDEALAALTGKDSANDLLAVAEIKFAKVLELVGQQNGSVGGFNGYGGDADDGFDDHARGGGDVGDDVKHAVWTPTGNNDPVVHRNNIRVQARPGASAPSSGPPDSARSDVSSAAGGGGLLEDEEEATDGVMDVLVPSRDILKM
ncbi:hypothetical protein DYB25_007795, partial [Aphanomyces astaci]